MITLCMSRRHQDVLSVIALMRKQVQFNFYHQEVSNCFKRAFTLTIHSNTKYI
jgi:hypothetical protein